jgi:hypothetical protein
MVLKAEHPGARAVIARKAAIAKYYALVVVRFVIRLL